MNSFWFLQYFRGPGGSAARRMSVGLLLLAGAASRAQPSPQEFDFDLRPGPLSQVLLRISELTGTVVSFRPDVVQPYQSGAVQGRLTPLQAMMRAARPSGLVVAAKEDGIYTLMPPDATDAEPPRGSPPAPHSSNTLPVAPSAWMPGRAARRGSALHGDVPVSNSRRHFPRS
jgi:hypothetical protein